MSGYPDICVHVCHWVARNDFNYIDHSSHRLWKIRVSFLIGIKVIVCLFPRTLVEMMSLHVFFYVSCIFKSWVQDESWALAPLVCLCYLRISYQHSTKCTGRIFAEAIDAFLQGRYQDVPGLPVQAPEIVEQSWTPPVVSRRACHLPSISYL
jgi:hypothetical protein